MKSCSVEGCSDKYEAKGYCKKHYRRYKKYGDPLATPIREYKSRIPYETNHKYINDVEYKLCSYCNQWKPMNEEHYYKNKSSNLDGFHPYCKTCSIQKSKRRNEKNREWYISYLKDYNKTYFSIPENKQKQREKSIKRRKDGKHKEWRQNNPEKVRKYNIHRNMNKKHDITEQEWLECLEFFYNSCAYCGITEEQSMELFGQQLHKEHVEHNGANDITNCVPACKSCNSQKWEFEINEWYNKDNPIYSKRRYNKIVKWLMSFAVTK